MGDREITKKEYDIATEAIENSKKIFDVFDGVPDEVKLTLLCITVDYIAAMAQMDSIELLDMLRPIIKGVNDKLGGLTPNGDVE